MSKPIPLRTSVIAVAILVSVLLYVAGVLSGLYANKITEQRTASSLSQLEQETRRDFESLRSGTEEQITSLNNYIRFLETNINTIQLQQEFLATQNETCVLSAMSIEHMVEQLQFYRDRLPFRLEQYEKENEPSQEYQRLKEQYNALSIRTWVFARNQHRECDADLVTGLYFYTASCEECVRQGEALDDFTRELSAQGRNVLLFTVDASAKEPMVQFLKTYYNITDVPAIVVNEHVYQGTFIEASALVEAVA